MPTELEIKLRLPDPAAARARLVSLGAVSEGLTHETNTFFDTPAADLKGQDRGLRIRRNVFVAPPAGSDEFTPRADELIVTYKGPKVRTATGAKSREEIELAVSDYDTLVALFARLGYAVTLSFEKHRQTFRLPTPYGEAEIVLDTLPPQTGLGDFLEIEADSDAVIRHALTALGLADAPPVHESYIQLIAEWSAANGQPRLVRFPA